MPPRTLLVVDDQHSVCLALAYFLENQGYRVVAAESGAAAVTLVEKEPIDGALLDVHMPVMNGFDTCLRLQSQAAVTGRPLKIWFMTGAGTNELERRATELGALGMFRKPFDYPFFLEQLEHGLSSPISELVPPAPSNGNRSDDTSSP